MMREVVTPYVTNVIADLLGVPEDDRKLFMEAIDAGVGAGSLDPDNLAQQDAPLILMGMYFSQYVADRRANPKDDVLSDLAHAPYPDGSLPDAMEIVRLATFLFAAGQGTGAKLLCNALCFIADQPGLQDRLRADPKLIPALIEEVLRLERSTKMTARLARKDSAIAGVDCPAGTKVMLALAAANRDPRRWDDPAALVLDRPKIREIWHSVVARTPASVRRWRGWKCACCSKSCSNTPRTSISTRRATAPNARASWSLSRASSSAGSRSSTCYSRRQRTSLH